MTIKKFLKYTNKKPRINQKIKENVVIDNRDASDSRKQGCKW
jgi:hypothetical protein